MNVWKCIGFILLFLFIFKVQRINSIEIDLIEDLNHSQELKSIISHSTVWSLNLTSYNYENIILSKNATKKILKILSTTNGFSLCVNLTQNLLNSGTLFTIMYQNKLKCLEIKVSIRRQVVRVIYFPDWRSYGLRSEKLLFKNNNDSWKPLCIEYSSIEKKLSLDISCQRVSSIKLREGIPIRPFKDQDMNDFKILIGQKMLKKGLFKGILTRMIFSGSSTFSGDYCQSLISTTTPTTPKDFDQKQLLTYRMKTMEEEMMDLKEQLKEMQKYLQQSKQCQCFPQCIASNGEVKSFGDTWVESPCSNCTCSLNGNVCLEETCIPLSCVTNFTTAGKCCPRCAYDCQYMKKKYRHNQSFAIKCMNCSCHDGTLSCRQMNPEETCPKLKCHKVLQMKVKGQCCKRCKVVNLCELSKCGPNAHCAESSSVFGCQCKSGYKGNPYKGCDDKNECLSNESCPENNECINTNGSYLCICKSGYVKVNNVSNICQATCPKNPCRNNSTCVDLDKCECKAGFTGSRCDIDINECRLGVIKCPKNSECINIPGGYICQCSLGFYSIRNDTLSVSFDHQCKDSNECSGIRGLHYHCEASSECVNLPGGYQCIPKTEESSLLGSNCAIQKLNGDISILYDRNQITLLENCKLCQCQNGILTCSGIKCDCSIDKSLMCCPRCSETTCNEISNINDNGFDLADFSCSISQTSCSNVVCPSITCQENILLPGQCCKYCRSDILTSCIMTYNNKQSIVPEFLEYMSKCNINGTEYKSGKYIIRQKFIDGSCLKCLCWNGNFCCGKSFACSNE